jgi:GT2 family glycosyltransferase
VPYNIGFKNVSTNKIIIQNPECLHLGDIISAVNNNLNDGNYLSFGCYSIDSKVQNKLNHIKKDENYILRIKDIIPFRDKSVTVDGENGWYNHYKIRPHYLHWCTAITKKDLDIIGGFDEEFANGIAYEDNEFLHRVKKQCKIKYINGPIVVHQYHGTTNYNNRELVQRNQLIAKKLMK